MQKTAVINRLLTSFQRDFNERSLAKSKHRPSPDFKKNWWIVFCAIICANGWCREEFM